MNGDDKKPGLTWGSGPMERITMKSTGWPLLGSLTDALAQLDRRADEIAGLYGAAAVARLRETIGDLHQGVLAERKRADDTIATAEALYRTDAERLIEDTRRQIERAEKAEDWAARTARELADTAEHLKVLVIDLSEQHRAAGTRFPNRLRRARQALGWPPVARTAEGY